MRFQAPQAAGADSDLEKALKESLELAEAQKPTALTAGQDEDALVGDTCHLSPEDRRHIEEKDRTEALRRSQLNLSKGNQQAVVAQSPVTMHFQAPQVVVSQQQPIVPAAPVETPAEREKRITAAAIKERAEQRKAAAEFASRNKPKK